MRTPLSYINDEDTHESSKGNTLKDMVSFERWAQSYPTFK